MPRSVTSPSRSTAARVVRDHPNFGLLVHLRYLFNEQLRKRCAYRIESTRIGPSLRAAGVLSEPAD